MIDQSIFDTNKESITLLLGSNDERMYTIRKNAYRLILGSLTDDEDHGIRDPDDLSCLPLSLWILKYINESILTSRTINFVRDFIERYVNSGKVSDEDVEFVSRVFSLTVDYDLEDGHFLIPVGQLISNVARLSGYNHRLIYQNLDRGLVICRRPLVAKVIREAFVKHAFSAYDSIDPDATAEVLAPIYEEVDEIINKLKSSGIKVNVDLGSVDFSMFPPCIKEYISEMREGINLPHLARFTLVSFLHKIGMDNPSMVELFKTAPDFNERLTTYQINHITGQISSTEYSPPKCSVLLSNHLCYKDNDPICNKEWLKHPLQYYTFKKKISAKPVMKTKSARKTSKKFNH